MYYGTVSVTNTKQFGYIQIQKAVQDDSNFDFNSYHFKYKVIDESNNEEKGTICTNNEGIATYGLDNSKPALEKGSVYTFEEIVSSNYATVYGDINCQNPSETNPYVKPVNQYITVTVSNIGDITNGVNTSTYGNEKDYCLSVKKVDGLDSSIIPSVTFELFKDNTCTTTTGRTATTNNSGIITFNNLTSQDYYVKEVGAASGYALNNNCVKVTTSASSGTCNLKTVTNDALYLTFYK